MGVVEHEVAIAGGGPTGMMLAAELALAGVDVGVVERRPDAELPGSRAGGLNCRTIEVLDQRGVAERFLAEGQTTQIGRFAGVPLDISGFPTRHPYGLGLWQKHIERILAGWLDELPVTWHRGCEVTGFRQGASGVDVGLSDGRTLRAAYLVGCDGGRSLVRREAGIGFPGWEPTMSALIAEAEVSEEPELGVRPGPLGNSGIGRVEYEIRDGEVVFAADGPVRVMLAEEPGSGAEPTLRDVSEGLIAIYGTDFGIHSPTSISRFSDSTRQAASYRKGRVLLAGDAAHVHSPVGGQGLNTGVQDAVNLGWKLARAVRGAPEHVLDSYHAERHPVGARMIRRTMAMVALTRPDDRIEALGETVAELLESDEPRDRLAAALAGLDVRYDLGDPGDAHPLTGRRMPDLDLRAREGTRPAYSHMHEARPVLFRFDGGVGSRPGVETVDAALEGPIELPALGPVPAPGAVLVRPDGHVAWAGDAGDEGLEAAVDRWFGP